MIDYDDGDGDDTVDDVITTVFIPTGLVYQRK